MAKSSRKTIAGVIAMLFAVALLAGPASPATAHDGLVSSTPGPGESVTDAPEMVVLTFSAEILTGSPSAVVVQVTDPSGAVVSEGDSAVDRATVTQMLNPGLPVGDYTVTWRVVSSDGHPISSEFHFFITEAAPAPSQTAAEPTPTPTLTPTPTAEPSPSAPPAEADSYGGEVSGGGATFPIMLATGIVVVLGVLVVAVLRLGQKRRARDARDAANESSDDA